MGLTVVDESVKDYAALMDELPRRLYSDFGFEPVPDFEGNFFEVAGRRLFVRTTADHSPLKRDAVYVHGLGGASTNWTDLMYLLEPVTNGFAIDLPGFGKSPMPQDRDYSIESHCEAVIAVIEDQCQGPVDLFGNSMGGAISIRIAATRPDLVRSLVLVSPAVPSKRLRFEMLRVSWDLTPGPIEAIQLLTGSRDPVGMVDQMHSLVYLDSRCVNPRRREQEVEAATWRLQRIRANEPLWMSWRGLMRSFVPKLPSNTWSFAAQVSAPTLAVFGTHDRLVDPTLAIPLAKTIERSTVLTMRTGHVAQMEHPVEVATQVLNLWAR